MAYGALVAYGAPRALQMYRNRKRMRAAMAGAKFAYKHRRTIFKAGKATYKGARRFVRGRRPRRTRMMSGAHGSAKSSRSFPQFAYNDVALRNLRVQLLPQALPAINANDFNVRDKARVYYSGYRICRLFENTLGGADDHFVVHWAIIQFKNDVVQQGTGLTDLVKDKFFRDTTDSQERSLNFTDAPTVGASSFDLRYNCNSMNPNKPYNIIMRKKFFLAPRPTGSDHQNTRQNFKEIKMWLPIKKNMSFEDKQTGICQAPMYEVYWTNTRSPYNWPPSAAGANVGVKTMRSHVLYFRDAK